MASDKSPGIERISYSRYKILPRTDLPNNRLFSELLNRNMLLSIGMENS